MVTFFFYLSWPGCHAGAVGYSYLPLFPLPFPVLSIFLYTPNALPYVL